jgi:hypothetical protein
MIPSHQVILLSKLDKLHPTLLVVGTGDELGCVRHAVALAGLDEVLADAVHGLVVGFPPLVFALATLHVELCVASHDVHLNRL